MIINIPFPGLYESWYSDELDSCEERGIEYYCEEHPEVDKDWLKNEFWCLSDQTKAYPKVVEAYTDAFCERFSENFDIDLGLVFSDMCSPKEYNFETDRLFARITEDKAQELFDRVGIELLTKTLKDRFTSYDGFIPWYSNRIDDWLEKPLIEWDHNELGTLLEALCSTVHDFDWEVFEAMGDEVFYEAWQDSVDWPKFEAAVTEHLLIEAGECEEDSREFPLGVTDPQKYVKRYDELNHLKE